MLLRPPDLVIEGYLVESTPAAVLMSRDGRIASAIAYARKFGTSVTIYVSV